MKNDPNKYVKVSLDFYKAIPPSCKKENVSGINVKPPKESTKACFNIDYYKFGEFINPYESTEEIFNVEEFSLLKNLNKRKEKLKNGMHRKEIDYLENRLLTLSKGFDINTWEREKKLKFDFKKDRENKNGRFTTYFKKVNRQFFKYEKYFYLNAIFKNSEEWCKYDFSSQYHCSKKDIQFLLDHLEIVINYKTPTSVDPELYYIRNKKRIPMPSKEELKGMLDFKEGRNFFDIEEFWGLSDLKAKKIIQKILSQKSKD